MIAEYEQEIAEQNRLLRLMRALDRDADDFDKQFDEVAGALMDSTRRLDKIMQVDPSVRRALGL